MLSQSTLTLRILVVDDNHVNQIVARGLLERHGHVVVLAGNGRQAVDLFDRELFDLVFMDVQMPEMDGLQATLAIRAAEEKAARPRTPIIALTSMAEPEDRRRCKEAGMDFHLAKPIDRGALAEALRYAEQMLQA